jgi:[acyl-carrier-protein] S-malonyltransferase
VSSAPAAWVAGRPIPVSSIDDRLARIRSGPHAARLPHPESADGRNMRRWLVQAVTTEAVVDHEAHLRGLAAADRDGPAEPVTLAAALRTGGVTAAIVAAHPLARALRDMVAPYRTAPESEIAAYYHRNRDRYPLPYAQVQVQIGTELGTVDRDRRFARWLDERCAALVRLETGFEHPGDPTHPDAVHRH